ncbi:MAG TPA: cbb3-type cytochrome c oxidase subunit II [Opitutaceae bacterium]|nr:cbb3-type cytochrome c oxidase subunit II [Opitutaceae bacterium]
MNKGPLLFLGIFLAVALSWTGIVLVNQIQYGSLTPIIDNETGTAFPQVMSGQAKQGQLVYQSLGCVYCHSQQVRRPGFGADDLRGWGDRQSVARDYVQQGRVFLGTMRTGPDLMNVGARPLNAEWHLKHLLDPQITSPGSLMPPFPFLFETRKIVGQPSPKALQGLPPAHTPPPGYELVPTPRAEALVAYLMSLKHEYDYPEAKPVAVGGAK